MTRLTQLATALINVLFVATVFGGVGIALNGTIA